MEAKGSKQVGRGGWARGRGWLAAFAVAALVPAVGRSQSDIPGFGGETLRPRLLVIMDTSSSMRFNANYSAEHPNDDFVAEPRTADTACRSKFCQGKRVLYDVLSSNASLVEIGLAGYFQSMKTVSYPAVASTHTIRCQYDVLAASGRFIDSSKQQWSSTVDLAPTVADGVPFSCAPETQSSIIACAAAQPDHQCTRTSSLGATDTRYQNPGCPGNSTPFNGSNSPCTPPASRLVGTESYAYVSGSSGWDTSQYRRTLKTNAAAACSTTPILNVTSGTSGCSTGNRCDFYLDTSVGGTVPGTVWVTEGTTHVRYNPRTTPFTEGTTTFTQLNGTSNSNVYIAKAAATDTCPGTVNGYTGTFLSGSSVNCGSSSAPGGCQLTNGSGGAAEAITSAADTKTAYTPSLSISGYTVNPTPTTTQQFSYTVSISAACDRTSGTTFTHTTSSYRGASLGCGATTSSFGSNPCVLRQDAESVSTDLGTRTCRYTRFTYTYSKPSTVTGYRCRYRLTRYTYGFQRPYCQYRRYRYVYRDTNYTYRWNTLGGELIGSYTTPSIPVPAAGVCSTVAAESTYCPPVLTGASAPSQCKGTNVWGCKLRAQSRYGYSNPAATSSTTSTYCLATDLLSTSTAAAPPMINPATTRANWCDPDSSGGSAAYSDPPVLVADYYDPATPNTPVANVTWDPPLPLTKSSGLSFIQSGTSFTPATSFTPVALNSASPGGPILQMLQRYDGATNPRGLRMPAAADGPFTPLFGSLVTAREYLQTLIDDDNDSHCRSYYVLLVTDGDEDTPRGYGPTDLVSAVTQLRNMSRGTTRVDVQTFVVGFGVQAPTLDQMAIAGGRPQVETGPPARTGAYDASDADELSEQLNQILSQITAGVYTRTRPVFTNSGERIYAAYFAHRENGLDWPGFLDAYAVEGGAISEEPIWKAADVLAAKAANSRNLFTRVSGATSFSPFVRYGSGLSPANCTMVDDIVGGLNCASDARPAADAVVDFVRNDTGATVTYANNLTPRETRMGDIYHSTPAAVGAPFFTANWGVSTLEQLSYKAFRLLWREREPTVYVGSNDGVVHAFRDFAGSTPPTDYTPGTERWGYVPNQLLSKLPALRTSHQFTADGNFALSDVCEGLGCVEADGSGWKTILVGTLGRGGPGMFALDVTDPGAPQYLWDFANEAGLGDTWSGPVVGRVKVNDARPFAVFVGGGFSTLPDKGNTFYALDALSGTILTDGISGAKWTIASTNRPTVKNNVPARPRLIRPNDGSMTSVVYFGDTDGKVMRMDVRSDRIGDWAPVMFNQFSRPGCSTTPLEALPDSPLTAGELPLDLPADDDPFPQIFNRAVIGEDDGPAGTGRRILYFGTGDVNNPSDETTQDYFYAVRDDYDVVPQPACRAPALWGKKLPRGAKVLGDPVVIGGNIIVSVYKPPVAAATCGASGRSTLYCFDKATGADINCLTPQATTENPTPAPSSYVDVGSVGIVSDLTVVGSTLVFNASSDPERIRSVGVSATNVPFQIRNWKRVK